MASVGVERDTRRRMQRDNADRANLLEWLVLRAPFIGEAALWMIWRLPQGSALRRRALQVTAHSAAKFFRRGEFHRGLWAFEPDVEYRLVGWSGITGLRELYTGHAGVLAVIEEWTKLLGPPDFRIERVVPLDKGVLATARLHGQGAASGVTVDRQVASIFSFSPRGRISHWVSYWNPDEAYTAVGLKP